MPKDWRVNVRYLLKQLFRWCLNCTEIAQVEPSACSFPDPLSNTKTYSQLIEGSSSSRCQRLYFSTLYRKCFTRFLAHQKHYFSTLLSFTKLVVKKAEEDISFPRAPRISCWYHFTIHSHLLHNLRGGGSSKQQGLHLKQPTYRFSPSTWRHSISPNFFYKPNTERKPKTYTYKSPYRNDKNTLLPFTKAIMLPEYAILPQRWASLPQQLTTISGGMTIFRAITNMANTFSSRYKRKRWSAFSCCAKRQITTVYFSLFPHCLSRKGVHFSAKVVLFFHPLLAPLSFPSRLPNEMGHFPALSHGFLLPAHVLSPFDHHLPARALDFPRPFHLLHKTKQQQLIRR